MSFFILTISYHLYMLNGDTLVDFCICGIVKMKGLKQMSADVLMMLGDGCKERLRHILCQTIIAAEHRLNLYKVVLMILFS